LITGGARGLGKSQAIALARESCDVAVLDIACGWVGHPASEVATTAAIDVSIRGTDAPTFMHRIP
jgi:NAD(P)-dependent dehydrogenase (short-subunit alcohol dehydrogenase family)